MFFYEIPSLFHQISWEVANICRKNFVFFSPSKGNFHFVKNFSFHTSSNTSPTIWIVLILVNCLFQVFLLVHFFLQLYKLLIPKMSIAFIVFIENFRLPDRLVRDDDSWTVKSNMTESIFTIFTVPLTKDQDHISCKHGNHCLWNKFQAIFFLRVTTNYARFLFSSPY